MPSSWGLPGWRIALAVFGIALVGPARRAQAGNDSAPSDILGRQIANFSLPDVSGTSRSLSDYKGKPVVVLFFAGTECPIANQYLPVLIDLQKRYRKQGLQILAINSNRGDTAAKVALHSRDFDIKFPVLRDVDQMVADAVGAQRTAEVFALDAGRIVRYRGRIDDRYGYTHKRGEPRRADLEEAIRELLAGKPVTIAETEAQGCLLGRTAPAAGGEPVTYAGQVSRILQKQCETCHHPGTAAPFSLVRYENAVHWSAMIKEVILSGRMPPWYADPRYGTFANDRRLTEAEMETLIAWIDGGTPMGNPDDLPEPLEHADGWVIGKPDVVFELPQEVQVPATGEVPYLYFSTPTNFKEDVWIQAAEARPGNRSVVHHIVVSYRIPGSTDRILGDGFGSGSAFVVGTAPGDMPLILPPGIGRKIPAGAVLRWQMHYTPTGKPETDRSQVGLVFYKGDGPPKANVISRGIHNRRFRIPAGADDFEVRSRFFFGQDSRILGFMPHMHLRGKDFLYRAIYPDGKKEILLSVPHYDFNWQMSYRFAEPLSMPQGTMLECVAHFDNSADNPANPDPTHDVYWGDQTWEEMMIGWMDYVAAEPRAKATPGDKGTPRAPPAN